MLVAKEVGGCSCCKNQIVVMELTDGRLDDFVFREDGTHLCHAVEKIFPALEQFSIREGYGARLYTCRSNLINEGWELVVVVFVYQNYLEIRTAKFVGQLQSAETSSNNNYTLSIRLGVWYIKTHSTLFSLGRFLIFRNHGLHLFSRLN